MGEGRPSAVDAAYFNYGATYEEIIQQLEQEAKFELRHERPYACL